MELAKINSKGQVTIPMEIRRKLGVKEGDKVLFIQEGNKIVIMNASISAEYKPRPHALRANSTDISSAPSPCF